MARKKSAASPKPASKRSIESYEHRDKQRVNNPPVGLVTPKTDPDAGSEKTYAYDPHLDPQLQWAGKAEHTTFVVPTVSLHVHERIDPRTIIEAVRRRDGNGGDKQLPLFATVAQNPPLRQAVEFYKHAHGWSNRLIAGDSLLVMNSLLEKEGMAGAVQMAYIDPPYGITYKSNFQPFVNERDVRDGKDEDLTAEPEQIRAFRDTWELRIHSYLTYLRDRLRLTRELLADSGSVFVQIGDQNVHLVRALLDEIFDAKNFIALLTYRTTTGATGGFVGGTADHVVWYAKQKDAATKKYRQLYLDKALGGAGASDYKMIELPSGERRLMTPAEMQGEIPAGARVFTLDNLMSQSQGRKKGEGAACWFEVHHEGRGFFPNEQSRWKTNEQGMKNLALARRLGARGRTLRYVRYIDDFPAYELTNFWDDTTTGFGADKIYVVQTSPRIIERCMLMTTDPGDLVFDPTCGSGTTACVAEQWGRRWITCDTSRVALTLSKQRIMTAVYDYYEMAHPDEGVGSGLRYRTVPHVTLKSIATNPDIKEGMSRERLEAAIARHAQPETLYDQPLVDRKKTRVSGPFTVEAVPAPSVKGVEDILEGATQPADASVARSGETLRQSEWRDELQRAGIRGKAGQHILFARLEPLPGCRWLHADGETRTSAEGADSVREGAPAYAPQRIVTSFGPEHAPLEQRQVEQAIDEARKLVPRPAIVVFASFQFDPEAAKDIDETNWPGVTLLKAQMNADLLTDDLKKKRASNESFWLIGQPDVELERITKGDDKGKWRVTVRGFDYYNTKTGGIESGGEDRIAVWLLDTDYDGRSLYPRQVFFPMAGLKDGWAHLSQSLRTEIDEELIKAYTGTASIPFEAGKHGRVAVKIVDDRGIESLKVLELD